MTKLRESKIAVKFTFLDHNVFRTDLILNSCLQTKKDKFITSYSSSRIQNDKAKRA